MSTIVPVLNRRRTVGIALLLIAACVLPFVVSNYRVFQLTMVGVYAIALLGLNLLTGYSGQVSLGHGAFHAIGAYTAAIGMAHAGLHYAAAIPLAGAVCLAVGWLFGRAATRLDGLYLALATFALGVVAPQLLKYRRFEAWTGGSQGLVVTAPEAPAWTGMSADRWLYFVCLAWLLVLFAIAWNLLRGRIGRAWTALRDQPTAARAMGVDTTRLKAAAFGISALYAGMAGALGAIAVQFVAPDSFGLFLSLSLLVGVVVGGLGSLSGALWGAVFIQFVPNLADQVSKSAPWAIYGALLIVCMIAMPTGVAGLLRRWGARLRR